jgi:cytochrome P450
VTTTETIDLVDPRTYVEHDMHAVWREWRRSRPVFFHDGDPGFWVVTRHRDNSALYRDNKRLSTARGNMLATLLAGGDTAGGRMVSVSDGRRHKDLRGVILKAFSQRALELVGQRVRAFTRDLMTTVVDRGECDFARDVGAIVPINTICELLGVPQADRPYLLDLNKQALSSDNPDHTELDARLARSELILYLTDLVDQRRSAPGEDVLSLLAAETVDGEPLSSHDVVLNCYSLLLGGDETSRFSMIRAVQALAEHPSQWAALRAGGLDIAVATEEVVRWATPIMHVGRTAVADVELGDYVIREGDIVTLWNSSANRDDEVFAEPDVFDLARTPNKHLGFGFGAHFCVGVYLARVEIAALLESLRDLATGIELTAPPRRVYSNVLDGVSALPVRFTPR